MDTISLAVAMRLLEALRVPAPNLVVNGNFADNNGTIGTGWSAGANLSNLSVSNNEQYFTGGGSIVNTTSNHLYRPNVYTNQSHVYYVALSTKRTGGATGGVYFGSHTLQPFLYTGDLSGDWTRFSACNTPYDSGSLWHRLTIAATAGTQVGVRNVICIDVTMLAGAGNEPTADEMDSLLAEFEDGWYDGTERLRKPEYFVPWIMSKFDELE